VITVHSKESKLKKQSHCHKHTTPTSDTIRHLRVNKRSSKHKAHDTRNTKRKLDKKNVISQKPPNFSHEQNKTAYSMTKRMYHCKRVRSSSTCSLCFAKSQNLWNARAQLQRHPKEQHRSAVQIRLPHYVDVGSAKYKGTHQQVSRVLQKICTSIPDTSRPSLDSCTELNAMLMSATRNIKGLTNRWAVSSKISAPRSVCFGRDCFGQDWTATSNWKQRMHSGGPMPSDLNANTIYHTECMTTRLKDIIHTNSKCRRNEHWSYQNWKMQHL